MSQKEAKVFNYYFLNKHLHPKTPKGYRESIAVLIINMNKEKKGKFLIIQERNNFWTFPKKGVKSNNLFDGIVNALVLNIGNEMGFRGIKVKENNPKFIQKAFLFNLEKQIYDEVRSANEKEKKRPTKGKYYHLVIAHYTGPDRLPIHVQEIAVKDYQWVDEDEGQELVEANIQLAEDDPSFSTKSIKFNIRFYKKCLMVYKKIQEIYEEENNIQLDLFK